MENTGSLAMRRNGMTRSMPIPTKQQELGKGHCLKGWGGGGRGGGGTKRREA